MRQSQKRLLTSIAVCMIVAYLFVVPATRGILLAILPFLANSWRIIPFILVVSGLVFLAFYAANEAFRSYIKRKFNSF